MTVALASPPLPLSPARWKFSSSEKLCCRCISTLSQSDSVSSTSTSSTKYRPAVILPVKSQSVTLYLSAGGSGLGNNTNDYQKLSLILKDYGVETVIAKVSRADWLRNAAGLLQLNYWRGTLRPRPVLDWYFKRVEEAVDEARELAKGSGLSLIGHSAGGWLGRIYLQEFGLPEVSLLLTLGTPHSPPPKGIPGVVDQTRGLLNYVEQHCPRAVYTTELRYVCIAGRYLQGARLLGSSNVTSVAEQKPDQLGHEKASVGTLSPPSATLRARFVGQGYKQVCGQANVWGDGIVPEMSAHLQGALNLSIDGVYHSPVGSDDESRPWYGSPVVVEQWVKHLLN